MPAPERAPSYEVTASAPGAAGGWTLDVRVPVDTALCDGHFPGKPIVPGVAQLALIERALAEWQGFSGLAAIPGLRLRQPVVPGDELKVWVREGEVGAVVFDVRRGGAVVANGSVARGAPHLLQAQPPPPRGEGRGAGAAVFPPVEELVPHRGLMLLVREVVMADPASLTARASVPLANPLASAGLAPAWLALEAAAQAAALHEALGRAAAEPVASGPRLGYLVTVRDAELAAPFPAGAPLLVALRGAGGAGGLATYEVEIALETDRRRVARGRLGTYTVPGA